MSDLKHREGIFSREKEKGMRKCRPRLLIGVDKKSEEKKQKGEGKRAGLGSKGQKYEGGVYSHSKLVRAVYVSG